MHGVAVDPIVTNLTVFVHDSLLDPRVLPSNLCTLKPSSVPSGRPVLTFENCP